MVNEDIHVIKTDGRKETLDVRKVQKITQEACDGLHGVSPSQVEMNSGIQFYDGIETSDIQKILVKSASDLISLEARTMNMSRTTIAVRTTKERVRSL